MSGEYCGPIDHLKGKRALLMNIDRHRLMEADDPPLVLAQFDEMWLKLGKTLLSHNWHQFCREDFCNFNTTETS